MEGSRVLSSQQHYVKVGLARQHRPLKWKAYNCPSNLKDTQTQGLGFRV